MPSVRSQLFAEGRAKVLAFCWLGWLFDFYDLVLFTFVKNQIADELQLDVNGAIAWVDGWTFLAAAVGGFAIGRIADRTGRRQALALSILCYSVGAGMTAAANGFWSLLLARVVTGLGVGGEWGIGHAIVAETYPAHLRGRAAGILQAATPLAMALAAAVGCLIAPATGWRVCFLASALPALLVFFVRRAVPAAALASRARESLVALFAPAHRRASWSLLALLVVHMAGFWSVYSWMPLALGREHKLPPARIFEYQLTVNLTQCLADVAFGFLADRFGRRRVFAGLCLLFATTILGVAWRYDAIARDYAVFTWAMAVAGFGTGTWSAFGPLFAANYPEHLRASAASGFYNLARGTQLLMMPLLGWLATGTGTYAGGLFVGAAMGVFSAVLIYTVPESRRPPAT